MTDKELLTLIVVIVIAHFVVGAGVIIYKIMKAGRKK